MKMITIKDLDRWGACDREPGERHDDVHLLALLYGRPGLTPLEVADLEEVSAEDRIWVLLRPDVLGDSFLRVVNEIADRVVQQYVLHCGIPAVKAWAAHWLDGTDRSAGAADAAAWTAARVKEAAACAAADAAAWTAARVKEAAACAAADAAAWTARAADAAADAAAEEAMARAARAARAACAAARAAAWAAAWAAAAARVKEAAACAAAEYKWQLALIRSHLVEMSKIAMSLRRQAEEQG